MNAVTIPGIWKATVTDLLLETAEDRGDAIALIDIEKAYTPDTEALGDSATRNASNTPKQAADTLAARSINNSYGATYYPWVRILDTNTNQNVWVPPTVAALGVLSSTDRLNAPWFAPAGFTRGGLSEGAAGLPVLDVSRRLTSDNRDKLYENNINPIAKFPAEGIVIFGQKTLQQTASALDRINVRRLMIFLKREISFIASRLLFGPNAKDTWDRFLGQAGPVLESVRAEFGIDDFRLVLDETTTTPDLIDRNIIYAKLLVKPTRSVEYFAIDFVVTNSGAAFED
jgi:phage tail sheath protein FI